MFAFLTFLFIVSVHATVDSPCPSYPRPVPLSNASASLAGAFARVNAKLTAIASKLPGLIAGVAYRGDVVWEQGYGKRDFFNTTSSEPPSLGNLVRIASISKVFTCLLMFKLRDEGILRSLDDPVDMYLAEFSVRSPRPVRITFRQLASHTAGLQRETPCPLPNGNCSSLTYEQILQNIAETYTLSTPYSRFHYSNLGMSVLGQALTAAANATSYEALLTEKVLTPLGITNAAFSCCNAEQTANLAVGVDVAPNGTNIPAAMPDLGFDNPCGGIITSGRDVLRMVQNLPNVLPDESSILEFLDPVTLLRDGLSAIGVPWEMRRVGKYWVKGKAGAENGYRTEVMTVPALDLSLFIGVLQSDVADPYDYTMEVLAELIPPLEGLLWASQPPYALPPNHTHALGRYTGGSVVVTDNVMYLRGQGQLLNLTFRRGTSSGDMYRARLVADPVPGCRWLGDGTDDEFVTFAVDWGSLTFMGQVFQRA